MIDLFIRNGEWVVVCDGAKAMVFENAGDSEYLNLKTVEVFEHEDLPTHVLGTDVPGRAINSVGNIRSAVEQTDWHDQAERLFLTRLAQRLDVAVTTGKAKSIVVVAPPRALGILRPNYTRALKTAIRAEVHKDLIKMPVYEIEKRLAGN